MMISGQIWRIWEFSNDLRQISQNKNENLLQYELGGIFPRPFPLRFNGKQWVVPMRFPNSMEAIHLGQVGTISWNHCNFGEQLIPESGAKSSKLTTANATK